MEITEFEWLDPDRVDAVKGPANGTPFLMLKSVDEEDALATTPCSAPDGTDYWAVKFVSAAARRKYAESGVAMPNGDFPIPDEGHLRAAIGRLAEYKGDQGAAKRHIIKRAKALRLTHLLPEDWHVSKMAVPSQEEVQGRMEGCDTAESLSQTRELGEDAAVHMENTTSAGRPETARYDQPRPDEHTGFGTTSPDKSVSLGESLSQTRRVKGAAKADHRGMGASTPAPHEDADTAEAERESRSQTEELDRSERESRESPDLPASPTEKSQAAIDALVGVRAYLECEVATSKKARRATKSLRRTTEFLSGLVGGTTPHQTATKEVENMDEKQLSELIAKTLDEREHAARKAAKKAAAKAEKAAKKAAKSAHAAGAAAKALDTVPAGPRPATGNHADPSARPIMRGQAPEGGVFKALEDKIEKARATGTSRELRAANREVGMAKIAANTAARFPNEDAFIVPHRPTPIFRSTPESDRLALAAVGSRSSSRADINVV